jgi:hypothetical protein
MYTVKTNARGFSEVWSPDGRLIAGNLRNDEAHSIAAELNTLLEVK